MSKFNEFKIYSRLSWVAYNDDKKAVMSDYITIATSSVNSSGFQAVIYEKDGKKVLAIRGTEFKTFDNPVETYKDLLVADGALALNSIPNSQYSDMVKFINDNKELLKGATVVGHSLGGTLAEIAAKSFPKFKVIN